MPDESDHSDSSDSSEELPVAQPLVSQRAARPQNVQLSPVAPATPRPVTTSTPRPLVLSGWVPLASTGSPTTPTPRPVSTIAIRHDESVSRKRSPAAAKSTLRPETLSTLSGDEWWSTGFMRDYRMPNFGWARENLFPVEQGTTPELAWMDIGPNGPLMTDKIAKQNVAAQPTSSPPVQQDRRRKVQQSDRQVQHLKPVHQAPKPIQQQKVVVKPQVVHQRPVAQQTARQIQQLHNSAFVAPANPPPQFVKKQPTQAPKPRTTTTAKPTTTTTTTTTTTSATFDYFYDDDSTFSNDDGQTHNPQK